MNKENQQIEVAVAPKVALIIASVVCLISTFLPWLDFGYDITANLEMLSPIYIVSGVVLLVLNVLALILKKKNISLTANILGIISALVTLAYTVFTILGIIYVYDFEDMTIVPWISVISSIVLFVASIVSIKKDKKKKHAE